MQYSHEIVTKHRPVLLLLVLGIGAGCRATPPAATANTSGDGAFTSLAHEILEDHYKRNPNDATYLGVHKYDEQLQDFSPAGIAADIAAARAFRERLDSIDGSGLSLDARLDREFLQRQMDADVVERMNGGVSCTRAASDAGIVTIFFSMMNTAISASSRRTCLSRSRRCRTKASSANSSRRTTLSSRC